MLGSKKKHILTEGAEAMAVVTDVNYAKVAGMTIARNYNYKLDLTLMVRPDNDTGVRSARVRLLLPVRTAEHR